MPSALCVLVSAGCGPGRQPAASAGGSTASGQAQAASPATGSQAPAATPATGAAAHSPSTPEAGASAAGAASDVDKPWPAPDFELRKVGGGTIRMADLRGKVVLVDFWATWCPPCKKEIPHLVSLYNRYQARGLQVVGIADDPRDHPAVAPFVNRQKIPFVVVYSVDNTAESFGGLVGYPTMFLVDRAGRVVGRFIGYTDERNLELAIQKLL